jgi:hypothetical protein
MARLVEAEAAAAGQDDAGEEAPALAGGRGAEDAARLEGADRGVEVVAHEVEAGVVPGGALRPGGRRVEGGLGGRQGEDQPAVAGIDGGKAQDVAEECAVGVRVLAVEDDVGAVDD